MDISEQETKILLEAEAQARPQKVQTPAVETVKEEVKTEPIVQPEVVEEVKTEQPDKAKKGNPTIGQLIDIKRENRELRRELKATKESDDIPQEETIETESEVVAQPSLEEIKAQILEELKPKLEENLKLRKELDDIRSAENQRKLTGIIDKEVTAFTKESPHTKGIVNAETLLKVIDKDPERYMNMAGKDLIEMIYGDLLQAPQMDSYRAEGKSKPTPVDFSNMSVEDAQRLPKDSKMQDAYLQYLRQ